jgi:hypothetical protein
VRFAHRFAGGPAPEKAPGKGWPAVRYEFRLWFRSIVAWLITVVLLSELIHFRAGVEPGVLSREGEERVNLMHLIVGAAAGALAAVIAHLATGNARENRGRYALTFAIAFGILLALSNAFVYPPLNTWYQVRNAESEFLESPAYRALKQHDRATYDRLIADFRKAAGEGKDREATVAAVREHVVKVVQSRLPTASNESVTGYMQVMLVEMKELDESGGDLCYRFLFPQVSGPIDPVEHFSKETQAADLAALAEVIRTSAENPQPVPEESAVMPQLQAIFIDLANDHGQDIAMLQNPVAPNVDRRKICRMTQNMYTKILRLPVEESGRMLRYLLGQ